MHSGQVLDLRFLSVSKKVTEQCSRAKIGTKRVSSR